MGQSGAGTLLNGFAGLFLIANHNLSYFETEPIPSTDLIRSRVGVAFDSRTVIILKRFLASNVAHAFMDDHVTLFFAYEGVCAGDVDKYIGWIAPLYVDEGMTRTDDRYESFYRVFADGDPVIHLKSSRPNREERVVCFEEAIVGMKKRVKYYDVGSALGEFERPLESTLRPADLNRFNDFFLRRLAMRSPTGSTHYDLQRQECRSNATYSPIVLLERFYTRRILNARDVAFVLSKALIEAFPEYAGHPRPVHLMSEELNDLLEIVCAVKNARVLAGMHGALLQTVMFLPENSGLVELFPFGLNPDQYTPYKTIATRLREKVEYAAWRNANRTNSFENPLIRHDGRLDEVDGVERDRIERMTEVPRLPCCGAKEFRYWLNQDTRVDEANLLGVARGVMARMRARTV